MPYKVYLSEEERRARRKELNKQYSARYYKKHRQEILERMREYNQKDAVKQRRREQWHANREHCREYLKKRYYNQTAAQIEARRQYRRRRYKFNPEKFKKPCTLCSGLCAMESSLKVCQECRYLAMHVAGKVPGQYTPNELAHIVESLKQQDVATLKERYRWLKKSKKQLQLVKQEFLKTGSAPQNSLDELFRSSISKPPQRLKLKRLERSIA